MKKNIAFLLLTLASVNLKAQEKTSALKEHQFKVDIVLPGISYEKKLSASTSLYSSLGTSLGFHFDSATGSQFLLSPYLLSQYRYYYNLEKRKAKTAGNSASFLAVNASYYFKPLNSTDAYVSSNDGFTVGPVWGFQKTYKSGLNLNLIAGLGYNTSPNIESPVLPIINFTMGWVID